MALVVGVLLTLWAAIIGVWLFLLVAQFRARRQRFLLDPDQPARSDHFSNPSLPSVCVVVPVRNAAEPLRQCVGSVLQQDYPRLTICIVDDRSEDDTGATAAALAREDPRIRVHTVRSLPPGWLGKSHALWYGTRDATEDWLLFVDDDCVLDPPAVRTAIAEATAHHADLLSLWPRQLAGGFWEHLLLPLCGAVMALWYGARDPNHPQTDRAFANGQFLLIRRKAYEAIDGHRGVRDYLIEDIPLATATRRAGFVTRVASGASLYGVRMYRDYPSIKNGWARIYAGTLTPGRIAVSLLWLLAGSLWPYLAMVGAGVWLNASRPFEGPLPTGACIVVAMATLHLLLMLLVSFRFWGMGGCRRRYLWLYPLSVFFVCRILAVAGWWRCVRQQVSWRNTAYRIDAQGRIRC